MYMLENKPLPPFDETLATLDCLQDGVCQPLAVAHGDDFVSLEQRDGTNEFDHCVLVPRALVPQLIAYLQRL